MKRPRSRVSDWNKLLDGLFLCPSCSTWRLAPRTQTTRTLSRKASTLTSRTAVNAGKSIPARLSPLYTALDELQRTAPAHVSLSRLQLAQQGLESESPKIRVAVLGLNAADTARKIARLLLADALEKEHAWEKRLIESPEYNGGVLIRYGEAPNASLAPTRSPISILQIPASILERANLEILVAPLSSPTNQRNGNRFKVPAEVFLAPTVGTPSAADGRQTTISQPVHASLVAVKGLDELLKVAELLALTTFAADEEKALIKIALEEQGAEPPTDSNIVVIHADEATEGLAAIRRSIGEATTFEHKWVNSGLPQLTAWLMKTANTSDPIPSSIRNLISSLLYATTSSIDNHLAATQTTESASQLSPAIQANLDATIDEFSRNAHSELQSGLRSAWSSRNWRKLAWYKLFWRVDDVGLIVSDLVSNAWLPRTERGVYELSGRLTQAGISPVDTAPLAPIPTPTSTSSMAPPLPQAIPDPVSSRSIQPVPILQAQLSMAAEQPAAEPLITTNSSNQPSITLSHPPQPIPLSTLISTSRTRTISDTTTTLTITAQQLLFRTLSISSASLALSGLTYISLAASLYSAGSIFAFGTAFALYRMQGGWMTATKLVETELYDGGRNVIQRVVGVMRTLVAERTRAAGRDEDVDIARAREGLAAVGKVRGELERLVGTGERGEDAGFRKR